MDNIITVSWCITDIFEYIIKYQHDSFSYSISTLKPSREPTKKTDGGACNDTTA